jgi:hypothetical protein
MAHAGPVPTIDLVDDTFVSADPRLVAELVADPASWAHWWPDLQLATTRDRGPKGRQWRVGGALRGTAEIWLEPWRDGVLVHFYLRAEPSAVVARWTPAAVGRERRRRAQQWKRAVHELKDTLERGRRPGEAAAPTELPDLKVSLSAADESSDER